MRRLIVTPILIFIAVFAFNQEEEETLKEYFLDAEFFLAEEYFEDALNDYSYLYNNGFQDNANINYKIGVCYLNIAGQKEKAIPYLEKAITRATSKYKESTIRETNAPLDGYLFLGNAYRINNELNKAITTYKKYLELIPESATEILEYTNQQIECCRIAQSYIKDPVKIKLINLNEPINSKNSNYKAVFSGDGKTIIYMNELPFYNAVYVSRLQDEKWTEPENITPQILSDGDQYVTGISYDGNTLLLTKEDNFVSNIYVSYHQDGRWTPSKPVNGKNINTKYWESHACLSKDGKVLYFASNRRGGIGETDIYRSFLQMDGTWGEPENIGDAVNTKLNDDTPFITNNGKTLYFSSQGHENMGGYDIFVSRILADNNWSKPQNLKYPVNTTDDNLFYFPLKNGLKGSMALIKEGGLGKEDIYEIEITDKDKLDELTEYLPEKEPVDQQEITEEIPVQEKVTKEQEETIPPAEELTMEEEMTEETAVQKEPEEEKPAETHVIIKEFEIKPVYFGFDKYELNEKGKQVLDNIFIILSEFPECKLKINGHTDAIGPEKYNMVLSDKRAGSVYNYLVSKGVSSDKLIKTGFGETQFIAINKNTNGSDCPEGRKFNRRVDFEILEVNKEKLIIKLINEVPAELKIK